jgi:hypothetical protein
MYPWWSGCPSHVLPRSSIEARIIKDPRGYVIYRSDIDLLFTAEVALMFRVLYVGPSTRTVPSSRD